MLFLAIAFLAISKVTIGFLRQQHRQHHHVTMSTSPSFASLVSLYDSFIVDQWGVLHDGKVPYGGVSTCLRELKSAGKQLILLSNSSKRRSSSFKGLQKVGIDPNIFDSIVTSGELAWHMIKDRKFDFDIEVTRDSSMKVFVIGNNDDDKDYVTSCGCIAASPEEADFVLARGTFSFMSSTSHADGVTSFARAEDLMDAVDPILVRCIARKLPMLVTNPDFHRPGSGAPMPGQVAKLYKGKGGVVQYLGKPYAQVYQECFAIIQESNNGAIDKGRICGVGDSLDHDILGAHNARIASVWTANGVHCAEMGVVDEGSGTLASAEVLQGMYLKYGEGATPTHTLPCFQW